MWQALSQLALAAKKKIGQSSWGGWLVVASAAAIFFWLQNFSGLVDPDAFYHAKLTQLLSQGIFLKQLAILPLTTLSQSFADHQLLYHIYLLPWLKSFSPLFGLKLSIVFADILVVYGLYLFLKQKNRTNAWWLILPIFSSAPWLFRLALAKASPLAVIMLLVALELLWRKKYLYLGIWSTIYLWFHGSFLLLIIIVCLNSLVLAGLTLNSAKQKQPKEIRNSLKMFWQEFWPPALAVLSGLLTGLIVNPYFPQNLQFYWQQIFLVAVRNYRQTVLMGQEWYPYNFWELLGANALLFIWLVITLLTAVLGAWRAWRPRSLVLALTAFFFGLLTVCSARRHVEFFVPLLWLFLAFSWTDFLLYAPASVQKLKKFFLTNKALTKKTGRIICVYLAAALLFTWCFALHAAKTDLRYYRKSFNYLAGAANWLKQNTSPRSLVFMEDWSLFPYLWYYNDHNTYLAGLDPTFFYLASPGRYQEFLRLIKGQEKGDVSAIINQQFAAKIVLVKPQETDFFLAVAADHHYRLKYRDAECYIFLLE